MNIKPIDRLNFTLLILLISSISLSPQANAASCSSNCLTVFSLSLTDLGTSIRASVKIIDEFVNSGASRNSTVQGMWTRPDGTTVLQYARIGTRLRADFNFGTGGAPGSYTFEVIDVIKSGYTFDPTGGVSTVASITIENSYNQPPVAVINSDRLSGEAPLTVNFDALSSHDPDGTIASYLWNFGDGTSSYDPSPSHTYTVSGTYTAALSLLDDMGARGSSSVTVNVTDPQPPADTGCLSQCLSLDEFSMSLKNGNVIGKVRLMDENGASVYDVTVDAVWILPDGSTVTQSRENGSRKRVTFKIPANQPGSYTLDVTNVKKTAYQYYPDGNKAESGSFVVE